MWWFLIPGVLAFVALAAMGALMVTSDDYAGAHTGIDTNPRARHRAVGLDDPTTEVPRGPATR